MKPIAFLALLGLFTLIVFVRQSLNQRPLVQAQALSRPPVIVQDANTDAFRLKLKRIVVKAERSIQQEKPAPGKSSTATPVLESKRKSLRRQAGN
jgi:hypothetical protein